MGCSSQTEQTNIDQKLQLIEKIKPNSENTIELFIKETKSGKEELYKTINDGYLSHYHSLENQNGNLYIIRRTGDTSGPDNNWSDELWRYTPQREEFKIYSTAGLDFRVTSDEKTIAITQGEENQLIFLTNTGRELRRYSVKDFITGKESKNFSPGIRLLKWSDDNKTFWGALFETISTETIFSIDLSTWQVQRYSITNLPIGAELELNDNKALLLYSDYPVFLDVDAAKEFEGSKKKVDLYIYNLKNQSQQVIATSISQKFNPHWIDNDIIEFTELNGKVRQKSILFD